MDRITADLRQLDNLDIAFLRSCLENQDLTNLSRMRRVIAM